MIVKEQFANIDINTTTSASPAEARVPREHGGEVGEVSVGD